VEPGLREVLVALLEEMEKQREQWEQSVTKTEFNDLKEIVRELAEAQRKTEIEIQKLTGELVLVKERLEGVFNAVGYSLENRAYKALPPLLKRDLGIEVTTPLIRKYLTLPKRRIFRPISMGWPEGMGKRWLSLGSAR